MKSTVDWPFADSPKLGIRGSKRMMIDWLIEFVIDCAMDGLIEASWAGFFSEKRCMVYIHWHNVENRMITEASLSLERNIKKHASCSH